jgi:hypothetical protein
MKITADRPNVLTVFRLPRDTEDHQNTLGKAASLISDILRIAKQRLDFSRVSVAQIVKLLHIVVGGLLHGMDAHKAARLKLSDIKRLSVEEINEV